MRVADLERVAEDAVEADLEVRDPGAPPLLRLDGEQRALRVAPEGAQPRRARRPRRRGSPRRPRRGRADPARASRATRATQILGVRDRLAQGARSARPRAMRRRADDRGNRGRPAAQRRDVARARRFPTATRPNRRSRSPTASSADWSSAARVFATHELVDGVPASLELDRVGRGTRERLPQGARAERRPRAVEQGEEAALARAVARTRRARAWRSPRRRVPCARRSAERRRRADVLEPLRGASRGRTREPRRGGARGCRQLAGARRARAGPRPTTAAPRRERAAPKAGSAAPSGSRISRGRKSASASGDPRGGHGARRGSGRSRGRGTRRPTRAPAGNQRREVRRQRPGTSDSGSRTVPGVTTRVMSRRTRPLAARASSIWSQTATLRPAATRRRDVVVDAAGAGRRTSAPRCRSPCGATSARCRAAAPPPARRRRTSRRSPPSGRGGSRRARGSSSRSTAGASGSRAGGVGAHASASIMPGTGDVAGAHDDDRARDRHREPDARGRAAGAAARSSEEALPADRRASEELLPAIRRVLAAAGMPSRRDCARIARLRRARIVHGAARRPGDGVGHSGARAASRSRPSRRSRRWPRPRAARRPRRVSPRSTRAAARSCRSGSTLDRARAPSRSAPRSSRARRESRPLAAGGSRGRALPPRARCGRAGAPRLPRSRGPRRWRSRSRRCPGPDAACRHGRSTRARAPPRRSMALREPAPEPYRLRPAEPFDLDEIARIEAESFPVPWKREFFASELVEPYRYVRVLARDGRAAPPQSAAISSRSRSTRSSTSTRSRPICACGSSGYGRAAPRGRAGARARGPARRR